MAKVTASGLVRIVEAEQACGQYAMSELTWFLLTHSFDYEEIAQRRIEKSNPGRIAKSMGSLPTTPATSAGGQ